jgi:hypothetical protein
MELPQQHTTSLTGSRLGEPQGSSRRTFGTVAASRAVGAVASVHAAAKAGEPRSAPEAAFTVRAAAPRRHVAVQGRLIVQWPGAGPAPSP